MIQPLSRVCCGVLSALLLLAPAVQAAPAKSRTSKSSKSSKSGASKTPAAAPASPAASSTPEPAPAAAPEPKPAAESKSAAESKPAAESPRAAPEPKSAAEAPRPAASSRAQAARSTPAPTPVPAVATPGRMRIGLGGDVFFESSRMMGEQSINASRTDESFDYNSLGFLSATAWMSTPVPSVSERVRVGAGLRIFGNYAAGSGRQFGFGVLNEVFVNGEYGLPVADKMELLLGGRAGLSFLVPGREFQAEIRRLQEQGVSVWSLPRVGWLAGPSVGTRRQMSERIWLRADLHAQVEQQYLFATSQEVSGLHYTKNWSTLALRLGLNLGAEFAL